MISVSLFARATGFASGERGDRGSKADIPLVATTSRSISGSVASDMRGASPSVAVRHAITGVEFGKLRVESRRGARCDQGLRR